MGSYEGKELQLDLALELIESQMAQEKQMKPSKVNSCLFGVIREGTVAVSFGSKVSSVLVGDSSFVWVTRNHLGGLPVRLMLP